MTDVQPYVAYHRTGGDIVRLALDGGDLPADGTTVDGFVVHRIWGFGDLTSQEWINKRIWSNNQWTAVAERPNVHAYWDTTLSTPGWNWDTAIVLSEIRAERNIRLANADWCVVEDSPLSDSDKATARTYRQSLRDITTGLDLTTVMGPEDVTWPTRPSFID